MFRPVIAALALLPAPVFAQVTGPAILGTRLDIQARGEVQRVPDVAVITAGVVTQASDATSALSANAERMSRVVAALKRAGVGDRDVQTSQLSLQPQYRYADNQPPVITGYQASNGVTVRFRDVARSGAILDALVTQGANQISGPNLVVDKPEAALDEARAKAIASARARAELYARAAGLSVKRIVAINESGDDVGRPPVVFMRAMAAEAKTPVLAGEQALGVSVSVTFELG